MIKIRIIPTLLIKDGSIVKTIQFKNPRIVGDIKSTVQVFSNRLADELSIIDIDAAKNKRINFLLIEQIAKITNMPLTYGGFIKSSNCAKKLYDAGVDKIMIRSLIHDNPDEVSKIASFFGNQSIIACLDYTNQGKKALSIYGEKNNKIGQSINELTSNLNNIGVGEILLNSVDNDGMMNGYDLETLKLVKDKVSLPIIVSGGCGSLENALVAIKNGASAIAAGSLFYWIGESILSLKSFLEKNNVPVRMK